MYRVKPSTQFKKDVRLLEKRGYDISKLTRVVELLADGAPLPAKHKDHELKGNWLEHRECHISPDWLLIYKTDEDVLVLTLMRTGSHSDLLKR